MVDLDQWKKTCCGNGVAVGFWICFSISVTIMSIFLLIFTYSYVPYDKYGLKKNNLNSEVSIENEDDVYEMGRYAWGPNFVVLTLPALYQTVKLDDVYAFTSAGIEVELDVAFQWRHDKSLIPTMFASFGTQVANQVYNEAQSTIKNTAPLFETDEFFKNREGLAVKFEDAVRETFAQSVYVELGYLQLRDVRFRNPDQADRYLQAANQLQRNEEEVSVQNYTLTRTETANEQQKILANITLIEAEAAAKVKEITEGAEAEALKLRTDARKEGLANLFDTLGFTTTQLRLDYLYTAEMGARSDGGKKTRFISGLGNALVNV